MMNEKELQVMVSLLDDPDMEVSGHIEERLVAMGAEVIPHLENLWQVTPDHLLQQRIEQVIHKIQFDGVKHDLSQWAKEESPDLLYGSWLIARYRYPDLDIHEIENEIDRIKLDVWLEMHNVLSALEKVRVLNHVIYTTHGFKGNTGNYHSPQNSFINNVLESRKGNPISMAIVYSLVAQRLNLPVYGVNLPQHFLLAYKEENENWHYEEEAYNMQHRLDYTQGNVLFYINAFNNGVILTRKNLEQFIKQIHLEPKPFYFEPCSNIDIIKRVLRNLFHSFEQLNERLKCAEVNEMIVLLGDEPIPFTEPKESSNEGEGGDEE
ncbi:MAG: transglutaminase-like domain-containing protein [Bacteroidia bacterium]|nr:transglutaminase-like domain-containing protein [Bacteroidia bacterium]